MPFELQPVLRGELVWLRPLRADDWEPLFAAASDPLIWEQHPESDRYKEDVFRRYFQGAIDSGGAFLILDAADRRVIGSSRFAGYNESASEIEIGWTFLARSHWGGACNRELKQLMLRHAFQFVDRVLFIVGPGNLRSQKALEKIGAVRAESRTDPSGRGNLVYEISRGSCAQC
jgi:RimJ/RimL family protein N-acetyltransferase